MHGATVPPGRVTRAISRAGVGIAHEREHELRERGVERPVLPGQVLGGAHAHVGAGMALAAGGGELRRRVDRGHVLGPGARDELAGEPARPAADVQDPHPGDGRSVGQLDGQRGRVAAHEAVVVLGRGDELHGPTQPGAARPVKSGRGVRRSRN